jgi:hypothetical protein
MKSRRFWTVSLAAAALALLIWFSKGIPSHLTGWLAVKKTEELYVDLHWAIWAVIIGVIIEEIKLLRHVIKFISHTFTGRFGEACAKAWKHKDELFEGIGFAILVVGLLFELEISRFIETAQKAELEEQRKLANAEEALAKEAAIRDQIIAMNAPRTLSAAQKSLFKLHLSTFNGMSVGVWRGNTTSPDTVPFSWELLSSFVDTH